MANSHKAQFRLPSVDDDLIVLDTDDIILDDVSDDLDSEDQTTEEIAVPIEETPAPTVEVVYTPSPGEMLIAENQVAGFGLVSVIMAVICGILVGIEVFKIWTHR